MNNQIRKAEELYMIQCSLLPEEEMPFMDPVWREILDSFASSGQLPISGDPAVFEIRLTGTNLWFQIALPSHYDGTCRVFPNVSIRGNDLTRTVQDNCMAVINDKLSQLEEPDYPTYQIVTSCLLPMLHDQLDNNATVSIEPRRPSSSSSIQYHALFTSHHLISTLKRRALQQWSSSLNVSGFSKVGYPGVIYTQGLQRDIEEFVENVKSMQWLALRLRFLEPLPDAGDEQLRGWTEFHKVGKVVEEMRRLGREEFVTEMGIGSAK